jgi:hypothetical protein
VVVAVKALACELPLQRGVPLSRWHCPDLARAAVEHGIVASISDATIWRWLSADAIKPWRIRSWILPRDPQFAEKAAPVLDLYHGVFQGEPLGRRDYVLSVDEKTQLQILEHRTPLVAPRPRQPMRVEHEYTRHGTLAYFAAWDVHHARLFGHIEPTVGIQPFDAFVDHIMNSYPYCAARNVFFVCDNGTSHRGQASIDRTHYRWSNAHLIHLPVHASWLNQVEIYFSILQRKALTPLHVTTANQLATRILAFQQHYEHIAAPFQWKFTRADLNRLLSKLATPQSHAA